MFRTYDSTSIIPLDIINLDNPTNPKIIAHFEMAYELGFRASGIFVEGNKIYLLGYEDKPDITEKRNVLLIINWTTNCQLEEIGRIYLSLPVFSSIFVKNSFVFLVEKHSDEINYKGFKIIDATNPQNLQVIDEWEENALYSGAIYVTDQYAYFSFGADIKIFNTTNPAEIQLITTIHETESIWDIVGEKNRLYGIKSNRITIFEFNPDGLLVRKGEWLADEGEGTFIHGCASDNLLFLTRNSEFEDRSFFILNVTNPKRVNRLYPIGNPPEKSTTLGISLSNYWWSQLALFFVCFIIRYVSYFVKKKRN